MSGLNKTSIGAVTHQRQEVENAGKDSAVLGVVSLLLLRGALLGGGLLLGGVGALLRQSCVTCNKGTGFAGQGQLREKQGKYGENGSKNQITLHILNLSDGFLRNMAPS
ncbi:hypothetical protein [Pseudomonas sp. BN417]|uniref:hypothetical protein n=1 Tax=Pseudomonas sp. BN417 TaxID=2567890 RepID=UPI002457884F|nr:hypothetical protein [Pseudomonas sp. BN417]